MPRRLQAASPRTAAHAADSLGPPVTHGITHRGASAQTGTTEPAVVHPVVGWGQLETQRHGLTFLRCSLRVVNGRVIVEMVANYSPYIEPLDVTVLTAQESQEITGGRNECSERARVRPVP